MPQIQDKIVRREMAIARAQRRLYSIGEELQQIGLTLSHARDCDVADRLLLQDYVLMIRASLFSIEKRLGLRKRPIPLRGANNSAA